MARKELPAPTSKKVAINEGAVRADIDTLTALGAQEQERVAALAEQVGYEGSITVGALEDEIRFYQRQTVTAILETGKRLLLLKEITPHGEFTKRAELLGFQIKTAQRFMQAALKTSKSDKLSFLASQAKNGSAFLELVTHDDDDLKAFSEMDDIDRMSASQVRAAFRELKAEHTTAEEMRGDLYTQIKKLKTEKRLIETDTPDAELVKLSKEAHEHAMDALASLRGRFRAALEALANHGAVHGGEVEVLMAGMVGQLQAELNTLRETHNLPDLSTAADQQLAAEVAQWAGPAASVN